MTVKVTLVSKQVFEIPLQEWVTLGKLKGFCKAKNIAKNQVVEIDYIN